MPHKKIRISALCALRHIAIVYFIPDEVAFYHGTLKVDVFKRMIISAPA